jgi:hypothetical protein
MTMLQASELKREDKVFVFSEDFLLISEYFVCLYEKRDGLRLFNFYNHPVILFNTFLTEQEAQLHLIEYCKKKVKNAESKIKSLQDEAKKYSHAIQQMQI